MNARPPGRITILWCPACGRDDRYSDLKEGQGRHFFGGTRCLGTPQKIHYEIPRVPEPLPGLTEGAFRAAVAVEVAVRPGLAHLDGKGDMTFVGRIVQYRANSVEEVAELAGLVLRDIAVGIPDAIAPHPRPEHEARFAGW